MATVLELTAPFPNYLVPVLPYGSGVCDVCWTSVVGYPRCITCKKQFEAFGSARADIVVPIALAVRADDPKAGAHRQFAYELSAYKNDRSDATRDHLRLRLAALLWRFLHRHESCLARVLHVDHFDVVTTVPSTSGRQGPHPMERIVTTVPVTLARWRRCLRTSVPLVSDRRISPDRFRSDEDLTGANVLLVDDQWTTGNHAQSAAHALKNAGASRVGVVVLGRRFAPSYDGPNSHCADYFDQARKRRFDWDMCCLEES